MSIQAQVLNLLADIRGESHVSDILISHDLAVVRQLTAETIVLRRGTVVERGPTDRVLDNPEHPYTQQLRASVLRARVETKATEISPQTDDETLFTARWTDADGIGGA